MISCRRPSLQAVIGILIGLWAIGTDVVSAQPRLPREDIASDIPPEVREQIERLYSEDLKVRTAAVSRLGTMREAASAAIPYLVAMLGDMEGRLAAEALVQIGDPAVKPLLKALESDRPDAAANAASALGHLKVSEAVVPLVQLLTNPGQDVFVRQEAGFALAALADPGAIEPLIEAMKKWDHGTVVSPSSILADIGAQAIGPLISLLRDTDAPSEARGDAAFALSEIGDPRGVEPLLEALKDQDPEVRRMASAAFQGLKSPRAVEPLIGLLDDEDWVVRRNAASSLGVLGDARAVEPLIAALKDEDYQVRSYSARALNKLGDPRGMEPLVEALVKDMKSEDKDIRWMASWTMGDLTDVQVVGPLIEAMSEENGGVHERIVRTLRTITGKDFAMDPTVWKQWWDENTQGVGENAR